MTTPKTLIVGHGEIGRELEKELAPIAPDIADIKYENYHKETPKYYEYDAVFICVPAEITADSLCDTTAIVSAINTNVNTLARDGVVVICTTVLPGTTDKLNQKFPTVPIIASPIWYGATIHSNRNNFDFNFTVLGGYTQWTMQVQQILQRCHDARHRFFRVSSKVAEIAKYMENCFIALKVLFCNQFASIANVYDVSYDAVREVFISDPRIEPYFTFVDKAQPYYNSHCTLKDVHALAMLTDNPLLDSLWKINAQIKEAHESAAQPSPADFFDEDAPLPI